jgi:peroxiredoxin
MTAPGPRINRPVRDFFEYIDYCPAGGDLRANMAAQPRNEVLEVFEREQSTLASLGVPGGVLPIGSTLPDVELIGADGVPTTLGEAVGGRPAVVAFYRGAWCPYCNITLSNYQALLLPAVPDRAVQLIAVSPQGPDGSLTMQQKHDLAFAVLSDPGNVLAHLMGIVTAPSLEVRAAQLRMGLDLMVVNADGTTELPWPTTAILDAGRVLRWIDVHPDYSTRSEVKDIIAALDALSL